MKITTADIKNLREATGARVMDAKHALEEAKGDFAKAKKLVEKKGLARAEEKTDRETKAGYVASYVHNNGQVASLAELVCETDFVAKNKQFQDLGREVAMQIASMNPKDVKDLLAQEYIRDATMTIDQLVKALSGKVGEKIEIRRFVRYEIGR